MEKTGLTSPTWIILIWNLTRGMSFCPILIFSIATASYPLLRTLASFSDRPKNEKRPMPILPLIRTSIPIAVDAAAYICGLKVMILSRRARMPARKTSAMTPVVMSRIIFLWRVMLQLFGAYLKGRNCVIPIHLAAEPGKHLRIGWIILKKSDSPHAGQWFGAKLQARVATVCHLTASTDRTY